MFRWIHMLMLVGLFAGLGIRASGAHFDTRVAVEHRDECCEGTAHDSADLHDANCPPYHHEHKHQEGSCCHAPVWFASFHEIRTVLHPPVDTARTLLGDENPPDGPVLSSDEPPLI